ncbi:MAG: pyridoxamine 5'-phosphate oxidase family protein [Candidatus Aminicenantales bacterium]
MAQRKKKTVAGKGSAAQSDIRRIVTSRVTRRLPRKALEARISDFLKSQNVCVLATSSGDIPRATPLEYRSQGLVLYMMIEDGQKIENLTRNPRVSVGIHSSYKGWLSVKGVQITGLGRVLAFADGKEFVEAAAAYPWKKYAREVGLTKLPANARFLRVDPAVIEFIDMSLKAEGYAAGQVWVR